VFAGFAIIALIVRVAFACLEILVKFVGWLLTVRVFPKQPLVEFRYQPPAPPTQKRVIIVGNKIHYVDDDVLRASGLDAAQVNALALLPKGTTPASAGLPELTRDEQAAATLIKQMGWSAKIAERSVRAVTASYGPLALDQLTKRAIAQAKELGG